MTRANKNAQPNNAPVSKLRQQSQEPTKVETVKEPAPGLKQLAKEITGWEELLVTNSSNVLKARFNEEESILEVSFRSGTYQYDLTDAGEDPVMMWEQFKRAESKGMWVTAYLVGPDRKKPLFPVTKV